MNLTEFSKEVHKNAIEHGWWEKELPFASIISLCHSELSEALEEYRDNKPNVYVVREVKVYRRYGYCIEEEIDNKEITDITDWKENEKPEGIAVELADCIIRILDYCGRHNVIVEEGFVPYPCKYLELDEKDSEFENFLCICHFWLSKSFDNDSVAALLKVIDLILIWAKNNDIDMYETIRIKHEYNKTRSYKHGGKKI